MLVTKKQNGKCFRNKNCHGFISPKYFHSELVPLFADPDKLFEMKDAHVLRDSKKTKVVFVPIRHKNFTLKLVVKKYNFLNVFYLLKDLFRPSKIFRIWNYAWLMLSNGINTAWPVAVLEKRTLRLRLKSYFVTEAVSDSFYYDVFFKDNFGGNLTGEEIKRKREFIKEFSTFIGKFHKHGFYHGHLSGDNLLVREASDGRPSFTVIDLDRILYKKHLPEHYKIRDLASVGVNLDGLITNTDRLRFFNIYCRYNREFLVNRRESVRQILGAIKAKEIHRQKRLERKSSGRDKHWWRRVF
jgi:tRNA A-37 threonylcarbamoyl transferase component Bud32